MALFRPDLLPRVKPAAGLRPVTQASFGGLNLAADPQEVGWQGAIDLLNVDFDKDGRVHTRAGTSTFATPVAGRVPITLNGWVSFTGIEQLLYTYSAGAGTVGLVSVSSGGTQTSVGSWSGEYMHSVASLGTPTVSYFYIATAGGFPSTPALRRYNGSTLTTVPGHPWFVAIQPQENRVVQASFDAAADSPTGANGSPSTVFFSDEGLGETWSANNFVHLQPGDGEVIVGMATWREMLFVFKQTNMFVFYGNNTDDAGDTKFNYRKVQLPARISNQTSCGAVAAPDGLYFITDRGVFVTTGGTPREVSQAIRPLFVPPYGAIPYTSLSGAGLTVAPTVISYANGRVYVPFETDQYLLVYDIERAAWSVWDNSFNSVVDSPFGLVAIGGGTTRLDDDEKILKIDGTLSADSGVAITSRYRTGFSDMGTPGSTKTIRGIELDGYGSPTTKIAVSDGSLDAGQSVTLGTSPAIGRAMRRYGCTGRNFSVELSGTAPWSASRLTGLLRSERPATLT